MIEIQRYCVLLIGTLMAAGAAQAADSCTEMQVYLNIQPEHREDVVAYIAPRLQKEFGVKLVSEAIGGGEMTQRIVSQGNTPRVSIAHWDAAAAADACSRGLCKPIDMDKAPNTRSIREGLLAAKNGEGYLNLPTNIIGIGLIYDADKLKQNGIDAPSSWSDLSNPKLKDRISFPIPISSYGQAMLVKQATLHGGGVSNIQPGFEAVKKLLPNLNRTYTWTSELSNLIQLGEVWLAVTSSSEAPPLQARGIPVSWVAPAEGAIMLNSGVSLVANGPCEEMAYKYLDLYYSDEFQLLRAKNGGQLTPSKTAWEKLPEDLRSKLGVDPEKAESFDKLDWESVAKHRPDWIKQWQREIR